MAMTCVNLCPYLIEFDIDGQPAGEDFLLQVEEMFDGIEDAVKTKIQESIYNTLDTQDDDDISTMVGFNLFDSEFRPDPPPNLNFVL
jgi:hypothetical protein